MENPKANN